MGASVRNLLKIMTFVLVAFLVVILLMTMVETVAAQELVGESPAVVVVDEVTSVEQWIDSAFKLALAGIGLLLTFAIRTGVATLASALPDTLGDLVRTWVDHKRQKDMHSAIMSQLATIIKEGRWTGNAADFILEIKRNIIASVPEAARHNNVSPAPDPKQDDVLTNLANRLSLEVQEKALRTMSDAALAAQAAEALATGDGQKIADAIGKIVPRGGSSSGL